LLASRDRATKWLLIILALCMTTVAQQAPPTFFGMNVNHLDTPFPSPVAYNTLRFWDDSTYWGLINTNNGVYDWTAIDYWTTSEQSQGVSDGEYVLGGPPIPSFAQGSPLVGLNSDATGTNQFWRNWVAAVSQHFVDNKFTISGYEIWNEFQTSRRWSGTAQQMMRLAEDARCIITGRGSITATEETCQQVLATVNRTTPASPQSKITSPSYYRGDSETWAVWQTYYAQPGAQAAAEIMNFHCYNVNPQVCIDEIESQEKNIPNVPFWMTETSWSEVGTADLTDQQKADWVTSIYTSLQGKVDRIYWYAEDNTMTGLLLNLSNNTANLAGQAYNNLVGKPEAPTGLSAVVH